jgi:hypothetical protein
MTNSDLITGALRLLGVLNEVQVASAEQGTQGLEVLNQIMADWEADGVDLQYYEQVDLTAQTPVPNHALAGVRHFLAFALAPEYGRSVSREMLAAGDKFYSRLTRDAVIQARTESKLEDMPRNTTRSHILTG